MAEWKTVKMFELWLYKYGKPFKRLERSLNPERLIRIKDLKEKVNKKYHKENDYRIITVYK